MVTVKRPPFLLYSYITAEMLAPFFASFLILYGVFFLVRIIPLLDVVLELKIGLADFVRLFCYIFPHLLLYVIPMASMIGVIVAFTRLTNEREMLVLKACGISLRQLLPPVLVLVFSIAMLTGLFSLRLIPAGEIAMNRLMLQLAKEKINKGLQERTFTEALGDLVVYVDHIDHNNRWHGVYVSDMRNRKQPIIIMSQGGQLTAELNRMQVIIILDNGTLHHTEKADNQVVRFRRYQIQIPLRPPTKLNGEDLTRQGRGSMSQDQLLAVAAKKGGTTKSGIVFLSEYHHRLALPVGCFILSLLGLPLGLQSNPGRRATGIPLGLFFFTFYYILSIVGRVLTEELIVPLIIGMWLPNVIMLIITIIVFKRVEQEKPIISLWVQNRIFDYYERYLLPVVQLVARLVRKSLQWRPGHSDYGTVSIHEEMFIHADGKDKIYHLPGCELYDCPLCTIQFKNAAVAEEAGFKPCQLCSEKP